MNQNSHLGVFRVFALALAMFVGVALEAQAQTTTANISGVVKDVSAGVLPGVTVTAVSVETGRSRTSVTDGTGVYQLVALEVGRYEVHAELSGFRPQVVGGVNLTVGKDVQVNLTLEVGTVSTEVTVTASAPLVDTTTVNFSGLVNEKEVKDLPLNGRSYDNLITLNAGTVNYTSQRGGAGVTGSSNLFSVSGRRPQENLFLMNGIPMTGASAQNNLPGGVSGQLLGIDAIREFTVQKDNYSAEFGGRAGGQINVVTMSGSNKFHGSMFEFLRNSALDARNYFDQGDIPSFRRNNFGASAGGPIISDKLFFFANYEGFRQDLGLSQLAFVPDDNARKGFLPDPKNPGQLINVGVAPGIAPFFQLWPEPNGRNLGDGTAELFSHPQQTINENFVTARVDYNLSRSQTLSVTYMGDSGDNFTPAPNPSSATVYDLTMKVATGQLTQVLSDHMVNTIKFGYTNASWHFDAKPTIQVPAELSFVAGTEIGILSIGGGGGAVNAIAAAGAPTTGQDQVTYKNMFTYQDSLQITKGQHLLGFGFSALNNRTDEDTSTPKHGSVSFNGLTEFLQGKFQTFDAVLLHQLYNFRQWQIAWYAQDTIKVNSRLTANLGLRHEIWTGWNEANGHASNFIVGSNGIEPNQPTVGTSPFVQNNGHWLFEPRGGLVWDPTGAGKLAVRGGFGIYYSLQDELGLGIQKNPPFTKRITIQTGTFPLQASADSNIPSAQVAPSSLDPAIHQPRVNRYDFTVQRQLGTSGAISIGYVGSHGYNEAVDVQLNSANPTICSSSAQNCPAGLPDGTKYFLTSTGANLARMNPNLGLGTQSWQYIGHSVYNAMQVEFTGRANGLTVRSNYTLAKSMDITSNWIANDGLGDARGLQDPRNPELDWGLSGFDVRHRLSINTSYEVPGPHAGTIAGAIFRDWQINTIINLQSGNHFTPRVGFPISGNNSGGGDRPSVAAGVNLDDIIIGTTSQWFDPKAFTLPVAGTYGNAGRNVILGPGLATVDLSLVRMIPILSGPRIQFRAEAFNVLNRANFGIPSNVIFNSNGTYSGSAGRITSTSTTSRQIQIGLKLIW